MELESVHLGLVSLNVAVLLILSAFFSGAETAFTALSLAKVEMIKGQKKFASQAIAKVYGELDRCIMTNLIMSNLVNILLSAYLTVTATALFGVGLGFTWAVTTGTVLILLFGEIIPKKIAIYYTVGFTRASAHVLLFLMFVLAPVIIPVSKATELLKPRHKRKKQAQTSSMELSDISEEEIQAMIRVGEKHGVLEKKEQEMLQKILLLNDKRVREVMTPKSRIVAASRDILLKDLLAVFTDHGVSRVPLFETNVDDITHIAALSQISRHLSDPHNLEKPLRKFALPKILKVPESMIIDDLFFKFQKKKQHLSIVVNENQETMGLVTMEDILEEVVGEIEDETDKKKLAITKRGKNNMTVDADMSLGDLEKEMNGSIPVRFPRYKSVGWLVMELLHRFPKKDDVVRIPRTQIELKVMAMEGKTAKTIEIKTISPKKA